MGIEAWTLAISVATALACSLCGVWLVVHREALVSEGLSHAVLPGIIIAFIVIGDRSSPWLILSAGAAGLLMVLLVQAIRRTGLVKDDASLGIVFPALFSVGVIFASLELGGTHFHAHCIIDGNLALAPFDRWTVGETDLGPRPFWLMAGVLVVLLAFIAGFFKELKLMVFDRGLARRLGFRPALLHVVWLGLVSMTTVGAFEVAGSILVVALMITPPAAAHLLTDDLKRMLFVSAGLGIVSAVSGFYVGLALDVAPAGPMATMSGVLFLVVLCVAPRRGLVARQRRRRVQRAALQDHVLLARLEGDQAIGRETLAGFLPWPPADLGRALDRSIRAGWIEADGDAWRLTPAGAARRADALPGASAT